MRGYIDEWRAILSDKKMSIGILGIMVIPVLYGALLLWAFWDPYGEIENLPVAIVNEDAGAQIDDEHVNAGEEFVDTLLENEDFQWEVTDARHAERGLEDFDYYFYVHIPTDFSKNVTSIRDETPEQGVIHYNINEDMSFVGGQLGSGAVDEMEQELQRTLTETYVDVADDAYSTLTEAVADLRDGAEEIADGTTRAFENMETLVSGLDELESGSEELETGLHEASAGVSQLHQEVNRLIERYESSEEVDRIGSRLDELERETAQAIGYLESESFSDMMRAVSNLETTWQETRSTLSDAQQTWNEWEEQLESTQSSIETAAEVLQQIEDVNESVQLVGDTVDEQLQTIEDRLDACEEQAVCEELEGVHASLQSLSNELEERTDRVDTLTTDVEQMYADASSTLSDGRAEIEQWVAEVNASFEALASSLPGGLGTGGFDEFETVEDLTTTLYNLQSALQQTDDLVNTIEDTFAEAAYAISDLNDGIEQLDDGASELHTGVQGAYTGSDEIREGILDLDDGALELYENLITLSDTLLDNQLNEEQQALFHSPVQSASEEPLNEYTYGEGLAPYFLSLALYVGGLTLSIIYPFRTALADHQTSWRWFSGKLGVVWTVATVQSAALLAAVFLWLDLTISNPVWFSVFLWFSSLSFMAIIFMLVAALDNPGRFIGIILLIIQLGGSGGSFPVELVPAPFQWVHHLLPMTYSVFGMRATVHMERPELLVDTWPLLLMLVISVGLAFLYFFLAHKKKQKQAEDE
ncbi:YhgE/Pip family protein [Geomicrobium sp. JSM 1781026]|uniref:YhgE/Pip family protein n=1 Tax=Geomicrobium sp. JSM 1781026 TaxID=3344580 RepID=UPI0035BEFA72